VHTFLGRRPAQRGSDARPAATAPSEADTPPSGVSMSKPDSVA
jgi:hypothetical protein